MVWMLRRFLFWCITPFMVSLTLIQLDLTPRVTTALNLQFLLSSLQMPLSHWRIPNPPISLHFTISIKSSTVNRFNPPSSFFKPSLLPCSSPTGSSGYQATHPRTSFGLHLACISAPFHRHFTLLQNFFFLNSP